MSHLNPNKHLQGTSLRVKAIYYLRKKTSAIIAGPANATTARGIRVAMEMIIWCDTIFTNKPFNCTNTLQDWIKLWKHGVVLKIAVHVVVLI